jgi:hypothetical protein
MYFCVLGSELLLALLFGDVRISLSPVSKSLSLRPEIRQRMAASSPKIEA